MDVVDARGGELVRIGDQVHYPGGEDDWMLVDVKWRSLLTRTAVVRYADGRVAQVAMPVKLFPRLVYGPNFPTDALAIALFPG